MNKKILIIVIGAILLSFSGCNDKRSNNSDNFTGSQITDSQDPGGKDTSLTFIKGKLIDDTAVIIEPQYGKMFLIYLNIFTTSCFPAVFPRRIKITNAVL